MIAPKIEEIKIAIAPGTSAREAVAWAIDLARQFDCCVSFSHNEQPVTVAPFSDPEKILRLYFPYLFVQPGGFKP